VGDEDGSAVAVFHGVLEGIFGTVSVGEVKRRSKPSNGGVTGLLRAGDEPILTCK
jgi:hypothetical protein